MNSQEKKGESTIRKVGKGLPQGAVLSPSLYSINTANITKGLPEEVNVMQFANDVGIYASTNSIKNNREIIENSIKIIKSNLEENWTGSRNFQN